MYILLYIATTSTVVNPPNVKDYLHEKLSCLEREYSAWQDAQKVEVCDIIK